MEILFSQDWSILYIIGIINNWQLINTKIANDVFIEFENVPQKALLAIKCSQGKQQRIFVCDEDNKIDWY